MNIKELKEMIQLMNENGLSEIEVEKEGLKVRLKKGSGGAVEQVIHSDIIRPIAAPTALQNDSKESSKTQSNGTNIKSPMVGTFYSAPAPDAPPFVQVGQQVEVGQVICIIEAMKLMNEIKAEVRGKISKILVSNGDPVEFGQPLFVLE